MMESVVNSTIFERIRPNHTTLVTLRNPLLANSWLYTVDLKLMVLDSLAEPQPTLVAVLVLPRGREHDPLIDTKSGQLQLFKMFFNVSRLIVVSNDVDAYQAGYFYKYFGAIDGESITSDDVTAVQDSIGSMVKPFYPFGYDSSNVKFVQFGDGLLLRKPIGMGVFRTSPGTPSYLITDELFRVREKLEVRRRLRFQGTGHLIHAEVCMKKRDGAEVKAVEELESDEVGVMVLGDVGREKSGFVVGLSEVFDLHNKVIYGGLKTILMEKSRKPHFFSKKKQIRVLCLGGLGAGPVLKFLKNDFRCEVVCVVGQFPAESHVMGLLGVDQALVEMVDFEPLELLSVFQAHREDAKLSIVEFSKKFSGGFDVLLVYMRHFEMGIFTSPPPPLLTADGFEKMKSTLASDGVIVIYFVPQDYLSFVEAVQELSNVFTKVVTKKVDEKSFILFVSSEASSISSLSEEDEFVAKFDTLTI